MRSVILWDPLEQIRCKGLVVCPQCQSPLRPWRRKSASTKRDRPRSIFCIQEEVLLVSCVYLCESSHHEVIAHDPSINLALKSSNIVTPFVLFHKSGVTRELYDYVSITIQILNDCSLICIKHTTHQSDRAQEYLTLKSIKGFLDKS